jgi:hypothetical protein
VTGELVKTYKVIFIERNKIGVPRLQVVYESPSFTRVIPYWPLSPRVRYRLPIQNEIYQHFVFSRLRRLSDASDGKGVRVINFDHTATKLREYFPDAKIVYYCNDEFIGLGRFDYWFIRRYHSWAERKVIHQADLCVGVNTHLYQKLSQYNKNSILIPLGAPSEVDQRFQRFTNGDKSQFRIKVAYVGFLVQGLSAIEWINGCVDNERLLFYIIGPVNEDLKRAFCGANNVRLLGPKTGEELYALLSDVNVCVAPYDWKGRPPNSVSNKVWLYLAHGKPIVMPTPPTRTMWEWSDGLVTFAGSNSDIPAFLESAFQNDTEEAFRRRIQVAVENSWKTRVDEMLASLSKLAEVD